MNNLIFDNLIGMINDLIILNLIALRRKELTLITSCHKNFAELFVVLLQKF